MQIDHITFSKTGGAGIVAQAIATAQSGLGHDVRMLTVVDSDLRSQPLLKPALTIAAVADEWLTSSRREKTLFSPIRANLEALDVRRIRPDSIIHLHWMAGVLNHKTVREILDSGRKVVWTMHDMNPFTGGCHHSHNCTEYRRSCSSCPQAKSVFENLVSMNLTTKVFGRAYPNLRIVSPNNWMSEQAQSSSVFRDQVCLVVSNPISGQFYTEPNRSRARQKMGINPNDFVAVVIAKDLRDPNKNLDFILKALEKASFAVEKSLTLLLVGRNGGSFSSPIVNVKWAGELNASQTVEVAGASDILLSASIAESAGMTIVECAAMGIPSVAIRNGGTASLITDSETGFLAEDMGTFVKNVVTLTDDHSLLMSLGKAAQEKAANHKPDRIAKSYIELYKSME